jgi:hypothetical protein
VLIGLIIVVGITAWVMAERRTYRVFGLDCPSEKAKVGQMTDGPAGTGPSPEAAVQDFVSSMQPPDFPQGRYVERSDSERFPQPKTGPWWDGVLVHSTDGRVDAAVMVDHNYDSSWSVWRFQVCQ